MEKYYNPATGYSYSYEEVLTEAEENKMTFEDFVNEQGLEVEKTKASQKDPLTKSIDEYGESPSSAAEIALESERKGDEAINDPMINKDVNFQMDPQEGAPVGPAQEAPLFSQDSSGEDMKSGLEYGNPSVESWIQATEDGLANNPQWNTSDVLKWESRAGGPSQTEIDFYKEKQKKENVAKEPTEYILDLYNNIGNDFSNYSEVGGFNTLVENPEAFNHPLNQQINYLVAKLSSITDSSKRREIEGEIAMKEKLSLQKIIFLKD